jgi:hypothetical protein
MHRRTSQLVTGQGTPITDACTEDAVNADRPERTTRHINGGTQSAHDYLTHVSAAEGSAATIVHQLGTLNPSFGAMQRELRTMKVTRRNRRQLSIFVGTVLLSCARQSNAVDVATEQAGNLWLNVLWLIVLPMGCKAILDIWKEKSSTVWERIRTTALTVAVVGLFLWTIRLGLQH